MGWIYNLGFLRGGVSDSVVLAIGFGGGGGVGGRGRGGPSLTLSSSY